MPADLPPAIICQVVKVHDGDGPIHCANGAKIRVAGVQAPDFASAEPCRKRRRGYVCDDRKALASKRVAERLTLGKRLVCQPVDRSYNRIVARCALPNGNSLSCSLLARGAVTKWQTYWSKYNMGGCR